MARRLAVEDYVAGVKAGDRVVLARAITLAESSRPADIDLAQAVLQRLLPDTGRAWRVGVTGAPGAGKSTLIDALGVRLIAQGHRPAVLAIDPSSALSGGSILGDKTRMHQLSMAPEAFVRPTPAGDALGGLARRTREALLLCEAAGFDVVVVETVGVGQSEIAVAEVVDCVVALLLPGGGDELQGIKKGLLEMADILAITKADGENLPRARESLREYAAALRYLRPRHPRWQPPALLTSAAAGEGLDELWAKIQEHRAVLAEDGALERLRQEQRRRWLWAQIEEQLRAAFRQHPAVQARLAGLEEEVRAGREPPTAAARALIAAFLEERGG